MDCNDAQRFVQLRLDEEIEPIDCVQLDLHLEDCPRCKEHVDREARFQAQLKNKLRASSGETCPSSLRDRIQRAIEDDVEERSFPYGRAVAASFAAAILAGLSWGATSSPARIYDETVTRHSSNLPPEVRPTSADESDVNKFFQQNLRYRVQVPALARSDLPVRLVGARLSNIHDRDAAYVMYEHRGAKLSLFAVPSSGPSEDLEGLERRVVGGRELYVGSSRGYNVVSWKDHDVLYSLVSDVDPGELVRLVSTMR